MRNASAVIVEIVPKLTALTREAVDVAEASPDIDYLLRLAAKGELRKIEDILKGIKIATEIPGLVTKLQDASSAIVEFATLHGSDRGHNAIALVENLLTDTWQRYPQNFTAPHYTNSTLSTRATNSTGNVPSTNSTSTGNVRVTITEIQDLLRTEVQAPFRNVTDSIHALETVLDTFPVKEGKFAFKAGVASYQRWSTVSMDLPCQRMARMSYNVARFKGSFDYPEFYRRTSAPKRLPWPNHHVPYVKIRVG